MYTSHLIDQQPKRKNIFLILTYKINLFAINIDSQPLY